MKAEIHLSRKSTYQTYLELEPKGTNQFAPRIGYYKVLRRCKVLIPKHTLEGVVVHWKLNADDEFDTSFETRIQLESFKRNPYPGSSKLQEEDLTDRVIHVKSAAKNNDSTGSFIVEWELLPIKSISLDALNNLLASGDEALGNSLFEGLDAVDADDDSIDYGIDDEAAY
ncbi:hypothetical protein HDC92_001620 [Pedobacter sp. AK017]|uniref:hypothetical protein n=1 Tax=Pedobacter sp. AK017 TaxID=2723073 RepID=UPI00160C3A1D|nr:hypothetical protein [Pedobacter sp. AK017]MBB5437946.1 hypothetical protein [Pedobacter sp. AK017]